MVKTSLRALLSHRSREYLELGGFLCVHLHNNSLRPSFLAVFWLHRTSALFYLFLGPWHSPGIIFSHHAKGFEGWPHPFLLVSIGRFAFAWEYICGHLEYYSQVIPEFPLNLFPSNLCRMLPIWTDWANPQELGSLGIASSDSKYLIILWGVSPAVWWWWFSRQVMSDSFATPWTIACQAPLSMGFSRQEYWRGLPFPSPGDLPDPGIEPESPVLAGGFFTAVPHGKPLQLYRSNQVVQNEAEKGLQQWFPMIVMLPIKESARNLWGYSLTVSVIAWCTTGI